MWWRSSLLLLAVSCYGQTAITELGSFWEVPSTTTGNVIWDYHGSRHAFATGYGVEQPATIFGGGIRQNASVIGGAAVPATKIPLSGSFTFAVWARNAGAQAVIGKWVSGNRQFVLRFSAAPGRPDIRYRSEDGSENTLITANTVGNTVASGGLALIWFSFNDATGELSVACNDQPAATVVPASPFTEGVTSALDIAQVTQNSSRGTTVGRFMYWPSYIPTDAERTAIYNGGAGREYTYFNPAGFTPPTAPVTDITDEGVFADDANLPGQEGLYWLRPYPLSTWSTSLGTTFGAKLWLRSTDHGAGGVYIGYSANPDTLPPSWSEPVTAAQLNIEDPSAIVWTALELPTVEWDTENSRVLLYVKARNSADFSLRATHVWSSTDLATWTWQGIAFPYGQVVDGRAINYPGYARVKRYGPGDWKAQTLINDLPTRLGLWISSDGISWTFQEITTCQAYPLAYVSAMCENSFIGSSLAGSIIGGGTNKGYASYSSSFAIIDYPPFQVIDHGGTGTGGDWLQAISAYEEGGTVWMYAKWSYQEPSTVRLFKGTLTKVASRFFGGNARMGGAASAK